jgi:hypothetical protein
MRRLVVAFAACLLLAGCFASTGGRAITNTSFWVHVSSSEWNDATVRLRCRGRYFYPTIRAGLNRDVTQRYDYAYCDEITAEIDLLTEAVPYRTRPFPALLRPDDVLCSQIYSNIRLTEITYCSEDSNL